MGVPLPPPPPPPPPPLSGSKQHQTRDFSEGSSSTESELFESGIIHRSFLVARTNTLGKVYEVRDRYRERRYFIHRYRYLSDLFYGIIHEGSLYKARFQEDKSRLISSTSAPSVNNLVFVVFYCCHCVVFSE